MAENKNILRGFAHKFGDDINTDYIIASKYKSKIMDMSELIPHIMEDISPGFFKVVQPGDFIVAGKNMGSGSSREVAAAVLREAKIGAVLAQSFARIFYRNCMNVALPPIQCDTSGIEAGDELQVDMAEGVVHNLTRGSTLVIAPFPPFLLAVMQDGGLIKHFQKYGRFAVNTEVK